MPQFSPKPDAKAIARKVEGQLEQVEGNKKKQKLEKPFEPRCRVCTSPHRNLVDAMLAKGVMNYSQIAAKVPDKDGKLLDRRSISNHDKNHLGIQDEAIRRLLVAEAEVAQQDYEEGVKGALTRRGALEVLLAKGFDDIVSGRIDLEAKDMLAVITMLEKMDEATTTAQVEFMKAQVAAFTQAIKDEIDNRDIWDRIYQRMRVNLQRDGYDVGADPTEVVDAEVVDEPALPVAN
jgi:hypothetical protein